MTVIHPQLSVEKPEDEPETIINETPEEGRIHPETKFEAAIHHNPPPAHHQLSPQSIHLKDARITEVSNSRIMEGPVASSASE